MKKTTVILFASALLIMGGRTFAQTAPDESKEEVKASYAQPTDVTYKTFYVYKDAGFSGNHFIPSGWMGDYKDISLSQDSTDNPNSGSTCIKIKYSNKASNGARWAGICWQQPANNWGDKENAGFDLTGAKTLVFYARGEKGGERIEEFKIGGINGNYHLRSLSMTLNLSVTF